ncbi:titin homolog [Linepithema humile]|uniref:titin homolog n=1 Tax=Linepithema humile TaxID=83485 RepID=UPI00351F0CB7
MTRSMAPLYDNHDYYKRMFELQEKLRKSEEDRIRLEERFNVLVRESRNRHDTCINRMRTRYIQYLEEQRTRDERNHKLLAALDKVMNKLALISAKKDRLNVLRKQYEAYLVRVYANRRPPNSVTGDSGIASQKEDRYTRKTVAHPDLAETRSVSSPRVHPGSTAQASQPRSTSAPKFHDQIIVNGVPLNNPPFLSTASPGASLGVNYHHTNILQAPHVYATPIAQQTSEQFVHQMPVISAPDTRQYLQTISGYDGSAPHNLQGIPNLRVPAAPVLPSADQIQPGAVPVNRFFREHVELAQAASGLPATTRFPAGDATPYAEVSRNEPVPPQFNPLFPYHNANILLSSPQSRMREYDPSAMGPTSATAKSSTYRVGPDVNVNRIDPLPGYMDYTLANPQKSEDEGSTHSLTSDDVDDLIKRNERLLWKDARSPRWSPSALDINNANLDENGRTTAILENELDRYISNIRKLHREHGVPSLEELDHEQNTSGDLLNVTLSEDALDLPAEERAKKERVPEEMGRILALASDLASRTANLKDVARDVTVKDGGSLAEVEDEIRHRQTTGSDAPKDKREAEGRGTSARDEIREDVATRSPELEQPRGNAKIATEDWNKADETRERDREASITRKDDAKDEATASLNNKLHVDEQKNAPQEGRLNLFTGKESYIEDVFNVTEELAPWDIASVQKKVVELYLDASNKDPAAGAEKAANEKDEEIANEVHSSPQLAEQSGADGEADDARLPQDAEIDTKGSNEANEDIEKVSIEIANQDKTNESKIASQADENTNENDSKNDEMAELRTDDQHGDIAKDDEYNVEQGYVEDPSQAQQYGQDPNEEYQYEQNVPYEGAGNEEYSRYAGQGYAQEGQEYVEYVDGQYEQYQEDPNNQQYQHDPNAQYEQQDPNQAYDYNYDPNQAYAGDQQYDPNQGYANDPNNQAYDYIEQVPYDPNQTYDNAYEQEYKEQRGPEDYLNEGREEKPETEEASLSQANPESEHKSDGDEDKPQQGDAVDEANEPKKKKNVIKSLLDSDTDTTIERNVSNTESDFDFN